MSYMFFFTLRHMNLFKQQYKSQISEINQSKQHHIHHRGLLCITFYFRLNKYKSPMVLKLMEQYKSKITLQTMR